MIFKTLTTNHIDNNYIASAKFKVWISKEDALYNQVSCQGILEDIEGRRYIGKTYKERAFPVADSLFQKIINSIRNKV